MIRDDFPELSEMLSCYFNQDFFQIYGTPDKAIMAFANDEPREYLLAVIKELDDFMPVLQREADPFTLMMSLGCYYYTPSDGLTNFEWIEHVYDMLIKIRDGGGV